MAVQVHGGHGYIAEHGMEQLVRDARIAQLYEGTNGIQALDLVGRKLSLNAGRLLRQFFHPATAFIEDNSHNSALKELITPYSKSLTKLQQAKHGTRIWTMCNNRPIFMIYINKKPLISFY